MRLIDADELKKTIINICGNCSNIIREYKEGVPDGNCAIQHIMNMIDNAPTVESEPMGDYQKRALELVDNLKDKGVINNRERGTLRRAILLKPERPQGEWIKKVDNVGFISHICSECGAEIELEDPCDNKFCFNCGAPMGGKNGLSLQKNDRNS